jgi:uncharacterized protein DUF6152
MPRKILTLVLMLLTSCFVSVGAFAHHGASRWDTDAWGTISGTVKRFDWQNPHPLLLVDVKNAESGEVETWAVEFHPPNVMSRGVGWTHSTFKQGDQVTIYGHPEKKSVPVVNGMKSLRPVKVTMPSGQVVTVDPPGY